MDYKIINDDQYSEQIIKELRRYNRTYTDKKESTTKHLIIKENDTIIGHMKVEYIWDWVTVKDLIYDDYSIFEAMLLYVESEYKDISQGIRAYTDDKNRLTDFKNYGFYQDGILPETSQSNPFYYVTYTMWDHNDTPAYTILTLDTLSDVQETVVKKKLEDYQKQNNITTEETILSVVALDDEQFVGGVKAYISKDTMYIHLLVVKQRYRHQHIGSTLMMHLEEQAKQQGVEMITLGTTEFQAREFYENLGYHVIQALDNYPKGYKGYTLVKTI